MIHVRETNVLFIWEVRDELREFVEKGLEGIEHVKLIFPEDADESTLLGIAHFADILVGWRPSRELLDGAERLELFINPGAGVQHHIDTFREINETRKVTLVNGHGNSYFTAQHAVALLLSLTNKIIPHHQWMLEGHWRRGDDHAQSMPLRGRKVGLLGYGAVNSKVHEFLSGFDVEFSIVKRSWTGDEVLPTPAAKYTQSELKDFLREIDTLIAVVPLTRETEGMLGLDELEELGPDGLLVTLARGDVIDEKGLYTALKDGLIAGAAIDVWYDYKPEPDEEGRLYPFHYPFNELDNVIMSPHRAASPFSDLERWNEVIENIKRFAEGRTDFLNIVDLERGY